MPEGERLNVKRILNIKTWNKKVGQGDIPGWINFANVHFWYLIYLIQYLQG